MESPCCYYPPECPPPPPPCCCRPPPPPCCPPQSQKLVMRSGCPEQNSNPFTFNMGGQNDASNNICVVPPACTTKDGTKITEISDPCREMFVLRIGKKCDGNSRRNVDLELCTPRPIYEPPPPELENRKCQYDPADFGGMAEGEKGKNKKGSGGEKKEKKENKEKGGGKKKKKK